MLGWYPEAPEHYNHQRHGFHAVARIRLGWKRFLSSYFIVFPFFNMNMVPKYTHR